MDRENIFSINLDNDEIIDREEFIIRRESAALNEERKTLNDKMTRSLLKGIPKAKSIAYTVAIFCIFLGVREILDYIDTKEFSPFTVLLAIVGLLFCVIFNIIDKISKNKDARDAESIETDLEKLALLSEGELRVPESAKTVDIFTYLYDANGQHNEAYANEEVKVFEEDGMLCIYFFEVVVGIPIESIESVVYIDYPVEFSGWNKEKTYDSEEYVSAEIYHENDGDIYYMDNYYSIRFSSEGKAYELMVPTYDIEPFLNILKLEVSEE